MARSLLFTALSAISLTLLAGPAQAQIEAFDATSLEPMFDQFNEIDFETLGDLDPSQALTTLRFRSVHFTDPVILDSGFCSSPTCLPDPDNEIGGNIVLFLNPGGVIRLHTSPRLVVLDIQGMGDNLFQLLVTSGLGHTLEVNGQGVLFGRVLLGLSADDGIQEIAVVHVGGTLGPLTLARLLTSQRGL